MNNTFWKNKKVLLTGHTGFKGTWLSLWLKELGAEVFGYALSPNTDPSLFNLLDMPALINHCVGDVRDLDALQARMSAVQPDIVIHMASQPLVRFSYEYPLETYSINVMGTAHILEAVKACPSVRVVINVTTDKCYENKEWIWGYRESEPLGGYDPYSSSKACSELVTAAYRASYFNPEKIEEHQTSIATARAGNVIGGGDWANDRLIPDIVTSLLGNKPVLVRNPKAIRPWQHVLEPLMGYLLLAESMWNEPGIFSSAWNFGPHVEDVKPVGYIVERMIDGWGQGAAWEHDKSSHPHEAHYLQLDSAKARKFLGWTPLWSLDHALDAIVEWYKAYACGADIFELTLAQIRAFQHQFSEKGSFV
ncbi:MAG: CDP-glucose 4,6-dehydratase [Gammaproteobacteria bacterium CG11_big_fil_rev_8_21_14_0_20_46_22]|nr:MAG: CDP-glucose 4,6-dehydratase [Gammaproteobacteria bacterium CG12_big_fil_rev_8_21_14_0_65_46_12]PIR10347.1 MAG: CDP-glucose 4,6-dehydratase [Gammaproteobacteria bacterium CG11_big_fil_rev_8_21_14_0_20_46_22]